MTTARVMTPAEFIRNYNPPKDLSPAERLAEFLHDGAMRCPMRFFDRRVTAKIAFSLRNLPAENSDVVRAQLKGVMKSVQRILAQKYNKEIVADRVDGIRATVDDKDLYTYRHRPKQGRVASAIASLQATDARVKPGNLPSDMRAELMRSRNVIGTLAKTVQELPQLTEGTKKKKETDR